MNISSPRLCWLYLRGAFWWTGLAFSLIGLLIIPAAFLLLQGEKGFERRAVHADATVTGKESRLEKRTGGNGQTVFENVHLLAYTFRDAAGRQFQGRATVSADDWGRANRGDNRMIEYNRDNPEENRPLRAAAPTRWGLLIFGAMGGLFALVGIGLASSSWMISARRARIVRDGTPVLGVVNEIAENDSALKVAGTYRLVYCFSDESGTAWEGRGPPQPWSLAARWDPGENILVLYDPKDPARNEADLFEARNDDLDQLLDQQNTPAE